MRVRLLLASVLLGTATSLLAAASATGEIGPVELISKNAAQQADFASEPALSANGRYVAFRGEIAGLRGVFRKDLQTEAIVPVAAGSAYESGALGAEARAPSISADGRYVSFTTESDLDPAEDQSMTSNDVYVRDMDVDAPPAGVACSMAGPCAFELASALNGSLQGLSYEGVSGSLASGRVALSADGRSVVFVTMAASNLTSEPGGSTPGTPTPAGQVVLRNLETEETTLVSVERDVLTGQMDPGQPVAAGAEIMKPSASNLRGAALSADGTTVAWLGGNVPAQVPMLAAEAEEVTDLDGVGEFPYDEPLWRRVADGPDAPTRRIIGGGDPMAPGCPSDGGLSDPACRGPFPDIDNKSQAFNNEMGWLGAQGQIEGVPQLSADGHLVGLIGNPEEVVDAFVVDMTPGLTRREAVRPITRAPIVAPSNPTGTINQEPYVAQNGFIWGLAISPDGRRLAFSTARQQFPLASPTLLSSLPSAVGPAELYVVDLETETLQRATHGFGGTSEPSALPSGPGGGPSEKGARSPSLDAKGERIAFSSEASNLVQGDANERSDVFVIEDPQPPPASNSSRVSSPPQPFAIKPGWQLIVSAVSRPNGTVRLRAVVPGAGELHARAKAKLSLRGRTRSVSHAQRRAVAAETVRLNLSLPRRDRHLAHQRDGLYAAAIVSFSGPGGKPLRRKLEIHFRAHSRSKKSGEGNGR